MDHTAVLYQSCLASSSSDYPAQSHLDRMPGPPLTAGSTRSVGACRGYSGTSLYRASQVYVGAYRGYSGTSLYRASQVYVVGPAVSTSERCPLFRMSV